MSRVGGGTGGSDSACVVIVNGIEMNAVEAGVQVGKRSSGVVDGGVERVLLQVHEEVRWAQGRLHIMSSSRSKLSFCAIFLSLDN